MQLGQVIDLLGLCGEGYDEPVDGAGREMLAIGDLPLIGLLALRDDDVIIAGMCDGLDAVDDLGEEVIIDIAYDDADGFAATLFEALGDGIGFIIVLTGVLANGLEGFYADLVASMQCFGNGRHRQVERLCNIFYS